jgi:hypothetical protein
MPKQNTTSVAAAVSTFALIYGGPGASGPENRLERLSAYVTSDHAV